MSFNAIANNSVILVFSLFTLLVIDLVGTSLDLLQIKDSKDSSEHTELTNRYNNKFKYTIIIISLVFIYYLINGATFLFAQKFK
ncbi:MAG: hypothetical protein ACRDD2_07230 [Sarcina sp.]